MTGFSVATSLAVLLYALPQHAGHPRLSADSFVAFCWQSRLHSFFSALDVTSNRHLSAKREGFGELNLRLIKQKTKPSLFWKRFNQLSVNSRNT